MKAIKITSENQGYLGGRFNMPERPILPEDYPDMVPVGYWLVTDFGSEVDYDLLTDGNFNDNYTKGGTLLNGFIEVFPNT